MAAAVGVISLVLASINAWAPSAEAATAVNLGTAESFTVLGGSTVTNTGPTILNGDLGVAPGTEITGFPPGIVQGGAIHANDAVAQQAQTDLTTAYDTAAGQPSDFDITADLGGQTLVPGVYTAETAAELTGELTLDAQNDPSAVWIFQIGSTLTTASASSVSLIGGAQRCNVFWQVGSSATLGTDTSFVGTIMALTSVSLVTGTTVDGRALARNGAVTLDSNVITDPRCDDDGDDVDSDANATAEADPTADVDATPDAGTTADTEVTADTTAEADTTADATEADPTADVDATPDAGTTADTEVTADTTADADATPDAETTAEAEATAEATDDVNTTANVDTTADASATAGAEATAEATDDVNTTANVDTTADASATAGAEATAEATDDVNTTA
ncbi:ice-binding family protein, partial [Brevibacterium sp.]|uniref:ice-binding family protein n=1 Tax=Brevibacterium sp. TaxID=1701 RepID=UPI0028119B94